MISRKGTRQVKKPLLNQFKLRKEPFFSFSFLILHSQPSCSCPKPRLSFSCLTVTLGEQSSSVTFLRHYLYQTHWHPPLAPNRKCVFSEAVTLGCSATNLSPLMIHRWLSLTLSDPMCLLVGAWCECTCTLLLAGSFNSASFTANFLEVFNLIVTCH